ncbi:MAG: hypothetical protein JNL73_24385 [Anaerolineales bacterium]|nr:hypothetical protein [Anaerolineales bacterium]
MKLNTTTNAPTWIVRSLIVVGGLVLAACAPSALLSENKHPTGEVTLPAMPAALATREATQTAATHTSVPGETSTGRANEATHTPLPVAGTAVAGQEAELLGTIESIDGNILVVSGRTVVTDAQTEIAFELRIGLIVKVQGTLQSDGSILAREIKE